MPGRLTTHVLDTVHGGPAAGMAVELWAMPLEGERALLKRVSTNPDGRLDEALLDGEAFRVGRYELLFETGEYWAAQGMTITEPPFLDVVPVRFGIADIDAHYHVPLLCSPWAYSTYRGS